MCDRTSIYVLTQDHMGKFEELISELQGLYCDIFSNRQLSITSGLEKTPASAFINAAAENNLALDDVIS